MVSLKTQKNVKVLASGTRVAISRVRSGWRRRSTGKADPGGASVAGRWACGEKKSLHARERDSEANRKRREEFLVQIATIPPREVDFHG
jgi:hypothetical protein